MLKKLFGKKNEFALQLDESQEAATTETAAPVEASAESTSQASQPETVTPAPVAVNVPAPEVPFWVTAMRSTAAIQGETAKSEPTFSTDYLLSSGSSSRRRPGPSLNGFKEIARQVRKPIS